MTGYSHRHASDQLMPATCSMQAVGAQLTAAHLAHSWPLKLRCRTLQLSTAGGDDAAMHSINAERRVAMCEAGGREKVSCLFFLHWVTRSGSLACGRSERRTRGHATQVGCHVQPVAVGRLCLRRGYGGARRRDPEAQRVPRAWILRT